MAQRPVPEKTQRLFVPVESPDLVHRVEEIVARLGGAPPRRAYALLGGLVREAQRLAG